MARACQRARGASTSVGHPWQTLAGPGPAWVRSRAWIRRHKPRSRSRCGATARRTRRAFPRCEPRARSTALLRLGARLHPTPSMRWRCLTLLDHLDGDESVPVFIDALFEDPVPASDATHSTPSRACAARRTPVRRPRAPAQTVCDDRRQRQGAGPGPGGVGRRPLDLRASGLADRADRFHRMDLDTARTFIEKRKQGVLTTIRRDGRPQLSNILYRVDDEGASTSRPPPTEPSPGTWHATRGPRCTCRARTSGPTSSSTGRPSSARWPPPARMPWWSSSSSTTACWPASIPDWDEYRQAQIDEGRLLITIRPDHSYGMITS